MKTGWNVDLKSTAQVVFPQKGPSGVWLEIGNWWRWKSNRNLYWWSNIRMLTLHSKAHILCLIRITWEVAKTLGTKWVNIHQKMSIHFMQVWTLLTFSIYCCSVDTAGPKVWPLCFVETGRSPEQSPVVGCFSDGMVQESWITGGDSVKNRSDGWWKKSG